ncbi:integral membrane protein [Apiospora arundinis]|uniref:Integral membrane protein n=1 Tax=Apiospora arundinis TaxID=335852 RepID=A0ABR2J457_9PEZI
MDPLPPVVITEHAVHSAHVFFAVTVPLVVLSALTFGVRMSRYRSHKSIWAEVCITLGFVLTLVDWALLIPAMQFTAGPKSPQEFADSAKYGFLAIPIWGLSMAFIKSSIGLTLLQIKTALWFRVYIWFNIVLMCLYGFGNVFFIMFQCRPLPAAWGDFAYAGPNPQCLPPVAITIASTVGAVVAILTDVLLSLAPLSFLWSLKRPKRERVVLGALMSLGLFAGACSLLKNLEVRDLADVPNMSLEELAATDFGAKAVYICIWTALEQLLGVVAACTPFCKPLFERGLGALLGGLHLPISIVKPSRGTATTSSFGEPYHSTNGYDRASALDKFRTSNVTGGSEGGETGGRGGRASAQDNDSDEVPLAIEMEPARLGSAGSKRQGVVRKTDIRIDSGSAHSGDLDRLESLQWK